MPPAEAFVEPGIVATKDNCPEFRRMIESGAWNLDANTAPTWRIPWGRRGNLTNRSYGTDQSGCRSIQTVALGSGATCLQQWPRPCGQSWLPERMACI